MSEMKQLAARDYEDMLQVRAGDMSFKDRGD